MNDAWNVIGWTAQQPPVTYADTIGTPWQIPADIDIVNVSGEVHSLDGGRPTGYVEFKASTALTHVATKATLTGSDWTAFIGQDGKFSVNLPATDTTALSPSPFTYAVTLVVKRQTQRTFNCNLPKATASVNFNDLVALP